MIIFSHPTGNANVRSIVNKLASQKLLGRFYTSIATYPGNIWYWLSRYKPFSEFNRRSFDLELMPYTLIYPWKEIGRSVASKFSLKQLIKHESGMFCVDKLYHSIDYHVASNLGSAKSEGVTAVYAYEDGALATFKGAKDLGMTCIYDLPIAYWETLRITLQEETVRYPLWKKTLAGAIKDSEAKLQRKTEELKFADIVVVPSHYVANSLPAWSKDKKIIISAFGSPKANFPENISSKFKDIYNRPLRILFAGSMSQRKGLADLFEAMKLLPKSANIELIVMGSMQDDMEFYRSQYADFKYEKGRPHDQVLELMSSCDVFCLPSLVEGRALVMQEAMSQGLPLIITPNTGGEDLIIEEKTGFLVPIRSPQAIANKILWFDENRGKIQSMAIESYNHSQTYSWDTYAETIIQAISNYGNATDK